MNFFAHGRKFLDDEYFVAGTAVPDWLNVVNRRAKARSAKAEPVTTDADPQIAALARGIVQHHHDDQWFHQTTAFVEMNLKFSAMIRDCLPDDDGMRPHFLGHFLVELLLDADLIAESPGQLGEYYAALRRVDAEKVESVVASIATKPVDKLGELIVRFCEIEFLYDYLEDEKLLYRLNQVMQRVRLPEIPTEFLSILPACRQTVSDRRQELLNAS